MRKGTILVLLLILVAGLMAGCQRPKPKVILPQATPSATPTATPLATKTPVGSPTPTIPPEPTPTPTLAPTATPEVVVHIVSFGETLFSIAQAYGVSMEALAEANGISYPYLIYLGQELVIPSAGATPQPTAEGQEYVVQYGDTLFSIAQRFNTTPEAIAEYNNLPDVNSIYVGQRLLIPPPSE